MILASLQLDIERAETEAKLRSKSSTTRLTSPRATDTENHTYSGNLSKNSSDSKEAEILQRFNDLYNQIPTPPDGEPIQYIEQRKEHDEEVLSQLDRHYHSLKDTLKAMTDIPISNKASLPELKSAAIF